MSRNLELALRIQADLGEANAALDQFTRKIDQSGQAAAVSSAKLNTVAVSAKQTANAMRMVPAQMTDIVTQLAGGQNPFLIMIQQGGQMKDSFGGIGPMMRGLAGAITPVGAAVAAAAVSVGALGVAYYQGSQEATEFAKANALTNNYIGLTVNQLSNMSRMVGDMVGSQHLAAEALAEMAASGKIAGDGIDKITLAAVKLEQAGVQAIKATVKQYAALADEPVKAALKLNESYHFLTLSVYDQIAALEKQGDKDRAAAVAQSALADAQINAANRVRQNLGYLEGAWKTVTEKSGEAWDAMLGIGRERSVETKIAQLQRRIERFDTTNPAMAAQLRNEQYGLQEQLRLEKRSIDIQKQQQTANEDAIEAARAVDQLEDSTAKNSEKRAKALEKYRQQLEIIRGVNPADPRLDLARVAAVEAGINKRYPDPKIPTNPVVDVFNQQKLELTKQLDAAYRGLESAQAGVTFQEGKASDSLEAWLSLNRTASKLSSDRVEELKTMAAQIDRVAKATSDLAYVEGLRKKADAIGKTPEQLLDAEITARQLPPEKDAEARKSAADISLKNDAETIKRLRQTFLQESGQTLTALKEQAAQKYGDLLERLEKRGDESGLKIVKGLINIEQIKAQANALQTQIDNIFTQQSIAENSVQTEVQSGLISEYDARQKLFVIRKDTAGQIEALLPEMQRLAQAEYDATGNAASLRNLESLKQKLGELKNHASELEVAFKGAFTDSMSRALADLATGTKNLGEVVRGFINSMATSLAKFANQQLVESAWAAISKIGKSGGGNDGDGSNLITSMLNLFGFASGGFTGFGGKYEPAGIVHKMEHVTRSEIVRQPGALAFLDEFNRIGMAALPGYARGGLVGVPRIAAPSRPLYQVSAPPVLSGGGDNSVAVYNLIDTDMLTKKIIESRNYNKHLVQSVGENGNTIQKIWRQG